MPIYRSNEESSRSHGMVGRNQTLLRGRILPLDLETATLAGQLMTVARAAGISPGFEDIAIAATAGQRSLTVVTANEKDFRPLGVMYHNAFTGLPG